MNLPNKDDMVFTGILAAITLIFFYAILGFSGMMSIIGIALIFIAPTYLILNNFELDTDEKIIFSFFIGAGIFPSITYWLGTFMSFRLSILAAFIILIIIGYTTKIFIKGKIQSSKNDNAYLNNKY